MRGGAPIDASDVDGAEQRKWWDVMVHVERAFDCWEIGRAEAALEQVRGCQHADALWLASLFPADMVLTESIVEDVLLAQGDDPRAMYLASFLVDMDLPIRGVKVRRAAEMGYAPAQAQLSYDCTGTAEQFVWAERAALRGDRTGINLLGECYRGGFGCAVNEGRAIELFRVSAELGHVGAMWSYGEVSFGVGEWERYHWFARGAMRGARP
jgi:hypothetical protein